MLKLLGLEKEILLLEKLFFGGEHSQAPDPIFVFKDALILMVLFSSILCHVFTLAVANASQSPTPAHPF